MSTLDFFLLTRQSLTENWKKTSGPVCLRPNHEKKYPNRTLPDRFRLNKKKSYVDGVVTSKISTVFYSNKPWWTFLEVTLWRWDELRFETSRCPSRLPELLSNDEGSMDLFQAPFLRAWDKKARNGEGTGTGYHKALGVDTYFCVAILFSRAASIIITTSGKTKDEGKIRQSLCSRFKDSLGVFWGEALSDMYCLVTKLFREIHIVWLFPPDSSTKKYQHKRTKRDQ